MTSDVYQVLNMLLLSFRACFVWQDSRLMTLRERVGWVIAVGVTTSSAISIKFTGLATPGECPSALYCLSYVFYVCQLCFDKPC